MDTRNLVPEPGSNAAPDCSLVIDPGSGRIVDASVDCAALCDRSLDDVRGETLVDLAPDEWQPPAPVPSLVERAGGTGDPTFEWPIERDARPPVRLSMTVSTLDCDGNGTERLFATGCLQTETAVDTETPPQHAEAAADALLTSGTFRKAVEHAGHAVYITNVDGTIEYVNPAFEAITGFDAEAAVGETPAILNAGVMDDDYYESLWETILDGEVWQEEIENQRADGGHYYAEQTIAPIVVEGEVTKFVAIQRDVTERKHRERELEVRSAAMEAAHDGMGIVDDRGQFTFVNEAQASLFGYEDPSDLLGRNWQSLYEAPEADRIKTEVRRDLEREGVWRGEAAGKRRDGTTFPHELSVSTTEDGGMVCIVRDITERKRREDELERYEELIQNVPVGVYRNTPGATGVFQEVNPAMVDMFDADSAAELLETPVAELYRHPDERSNLDRKLSSSGIVVDEEIRLETLDGDPFWGSITAIRHEIDGEVYYDGIIQDITERKERSRQVRVREQRFRRLFEDHSAPMLLVDPESGAIERANDAAASFYGYEQAELTSLSIQDINQLSDDEVAARRDSAAEGELNTFIFPHELATGEVRQVEVHSSPIHTGERELLFSIIHDVTEREAYRAEVERQNERLEVLNRVVRHDIRNDMSVVIGNAEVLETHVDEDGATCVETIKEHSRHAAELTKTVRELMDAMLAAESVELEPVTLSRVLSAEIEELETTYDAAEVETVTPLPNVQVAGNEMLSSVFRNLLTYAVQHNDAAVPAVTVGADERADSVVVRIGDNGPGIPEDRRDEIFGKGERGIESDGTGLGLYLVNTLVDQFGGEVWVEDRAGRNDGDELSASDGSEPRGSVFAVQLPKT